MDHTTQRVLHVTVKPERATVSPGSIAGSAMRPGDTLSDCLNSKDDFNGRTKRGRRRHLARSSKSKLFGQKADGPGKQQQGGARYERQRTETPPGLDENCGGGAGCRR